MKFVALWTVLAVAWAYTIKLGSLLVNDKKIAIGEANTLQIQSLPVLAPQDVIAVELNLKKTADEPQQLVIQFASALKPEYLIQKVPKFTDGSKVSLSLTAKALPEALKSGPIAVKFIIALLSDRLVKLLGQLEPLTEISQAVKLVQQDDRLGAKPEIFHQFRSNPETVNPAIPIVFLGVAFVLFVALLIGWYGVVGLDAIFYQFRFITKIQLIYNASFLTTLGVFQVIIARYYLGELIFATVKWALVVAVPAVFLGSKVLRFLKATQAAGRA